VTGLSPEREAEIRESLLVGRTHGVAAVIELLAEIDRLRELADKSMRALEEADRRRMEHVKRADRAEQAIRDALGVPTFPLDVAVNQMQRILRAGLGE